MAGDPLAPGEETEGSAGTEVVALVERFGKELWILGGAGGTGLAMMGGQRGGRGWIEGYHGAG